MNNRILRNTFISCHKTGNPKVTHTRLYNLHWVLTLIFTLFHSCEKPERDNPWDEFAKISPDSWAPQNLEIEAISITSRKLTWEYNGDDRIEGFQLDRRVGDGSWQVGVAVLDKETLEWVDKEIVPDNELIYQYRLYTIAGKNSSAAIKLITDDNFPAPNNLLIEKKTDVSYKLHWTNSFTGEQGIKIDRRVEQNDWELAFARLEAGQTSYVDTNVFLPKTSKVLVEYRVYGYHDNYHSVKAYGSTNAALTPPSGLQISQNSLTAVTLTWQDNATASQGFKVERRYSANDDWTEIATTKTPEFQDTDFTLNTHVYYRISAFTGEYHSAYAKNSFDATIPAPSNLQITQNSITSVTLNWQDNHLKPQGFKIERKIDNDDWTEIATTTTPEFQDTDFALNTHVNYRVSAFKGEYHSAYTEISFDATIPSPLDLSAAVQSATSVEISWGYEILGHQGFKIDRQTDHDAWETTFATSDPDETSYLDNMVDFEQHGYQYRVYAWYDNYESPKTEMYIARATVTTDGITSIKSTSASGGGNVTANDSATVIARGIAYDTSENPTIDENSVSAGSGTGSFTVNMTGLKPFTTYYVRAYATNNAGTAYGEQASFTTFGDGATGIASDIDGNIYKTVVIGDKWWMAENLKTTKYQNGTHINYPGSDITAWQNSTNGAYAWYYNDIDNKETYGALYNWHAVNNSNGLCPEGWRVPSDAEWTALTNYLSSEYGITNSNVLDGAGKALKSCRQVSSPLGGDCATSQHPRWNPHSTHYGTNEFGFSALPAGFRFADGMFGDQGEIGCWWSSTESSTSSAWFHSIYHYFGFVDRFNFSKSVGRSVRCIRDLGD